MRDSEPLLQAMQQQDSYPSLVRFLLLLLILVVLGSSIALLAMGGLRHRVLTRLGEEWLRVYASEEDRGVFRLPPPPPKTIEPRVVVQEPVSPRATVRGIPESPGGFVEAESEASPAFVPPVKTPHIEAAFEILKSESPVAAELVAGSLPGYEFKEWKPVKSSPPEYWIDLVARYQGSEVHLIWAVNVDETSVRPLSQAARDLAAQMGS